MRKGKMIAQGSHASLSAYINAPVGLQKEWRKTGQAKIVVYVKSEEELLQIFQKATSNDLWPELVVDAGHTEFHGIPTRTAIGIGPNYSDKIDIVTGALPLL